MSKKKGILAHELVDNKRNVDKARFEAALSPSAQYATLCSSSKMPQELLSNVYSLLYNNNDICLCDKAVIECQMLSGARISQVLHIKSCDITPAGVIKITGSKGSNSIVYTPVLYRQYWLDVRRLGVVISQFRDRYYYYRLYRKYGIYSLVVGNSNTSVTHSLRHALLSETEQLDITSVERANKVGHKSLKSQDSYLPSKRVENEKNKRSIK